MNSAENSKSKRNVLVNGNKLRGIRETLRLTQIEAAALAGYSTRLIRKLESGGSVSRETLNNVVTAYQESLTRASDSALPRTLRPIDFILCTPVDAMQQVAHDWFDRVFNQRDLSAVDDLVHPEITLIAEGQTLKGQEAVKARLRAILDGFNPLRLCIEHLFSDGQTTIVYWQWMRLTQASSLESLRHPGRFRFAEPPWQ